ncbi:MAG TPA: DUF2865 domain-containing protein [Propylenella sp.]
MHRAATVLTAGIAGLSVLAAEVAEAATCFTLQAELMHLQARSGGGFGDGARYEQAWQEQARVLARTEMRARDAGCFGGFFIFRREPARTCRTLVPKLQEMQTNLVRLDRLRRQRGHGNARRIHELQGMLAARGCGLPNRDFYEGPDGQEWTREQDVRLYPRGTYRTLCVRSCDGYYFPISFSTTPDRFPDDASACEAMCPGTEAKLFYHSNPGGGPENMTSIAGEPYSSLETAFQYRTSYNPACTCRPAGGYSVAAATAGGDAGAGNAGPPLPQPRPTPGEDPETLANRAGHFVPRPLSAETAEAVSAMTTEGGRSVRVVGPAYWGARSAEDVVLTPVPN